MKLEHVLRVYPFALGCVAAILFFLGVPNWTNLLAAWYGLFVTVALLTFYNAPSHQWLRGHLRHRRFNQLYLALAKPVLNRVGGWIGAERPEPDHRGLMRTFQDSATYNQLDRAILLAVAYPFMLAFLWWGVSGRAVSLVSAEFLPAEDRELLRYAALGVIAMLLFSPILQKWAAASPKRFVRSVSGWLTLGALAGAVALAVAAAGAVVGAFAFAFASVGAGAGAFAVAGAFVGTFALAVIFVFARLYRTNRHRLASVPLLAIPTGAMVLSILIADWSSLDPAAPSLFLFFAVLPLINGVFDFLSYLVTYSLARIGLRGRRVAVFLGFLDAMIAVLVFCALGATLVAVVTAMNRQTGVVFADLPAILPNLSDWRTYWWLYAMAFSTAVPTLFHLCIGAFSLQALAPFGWRERLADMIARCEDDTFAATFAPLFLGGLWCFAVTVPFAMLAGVGFIARDWLIAAGTAYQDFLISVAVYFGGM